MAATPSKQTRLDAFLPKVDTTAKLPAKSWREDVPNVSSAPLENHPHRVYVLCGVVGSGKSTLAEQWEALYPDNYVRICQDKLGDRRRCEEMTGYALESGKSPIIDRQNFDPSQRYHWLAIGHRHEVEVIALVFHTSQRTCADRLLLRTGHETIKTPDEGIRVLNSMISIFTEPTPVEGFHKIVELSAGLPLHYSLTDINALLALVDSSEVLPGVLPPPPRVIPRGTPHNRGRGYERGRGRGSPRGASSMSWRVPPQNTAFAPNCQAATNMASSGVPEQTTGLSQSCNDSHHRNIPQPYIAPANRSVGRTITARPNTTTASTGFIDISSDDER